MCSGEMISMAVISAYHVPNNLDEAAGFLDSVKNSRILAGGTDLLLKLRKGPAEPAAIVSLKNIEELRSFDERKDGSLYIGSMAPLDILEHSELIRKGYPALAEAAASVGSPSLRVTATIGGNICNASPSADMAPPLLVYGAEAVIFGNSGERTVPVESFFTGPGSTVLERGEILTGFTLPAREEGTVSRFLKFGRVKAMDVSTVNAAVSLVIDRGVCRSPRIALGAVAATPVRLPEAAKLLAGQSYPFSPELVASAAEAAVKASAPIDDIRASAQYRRSLVRVLVSRLLSGQKSIDGTEAAL